MARGYKGTMAAGMLAMAVMITVVSAAWEPAKSASADISIPSADAQTPPYMVLWQHQQHQLPPITPTQSKSSGDNDDRYGGFVSMGEHVYSWTDKVHITIVSHDHNFDENAIDTIGGSADDAIKIHTKESTIKQYKLVETGPDTGIFRGSITLIGFDHDADGNPQTGSRPGGYDNPQREPGGSGPSGGYLAAGRNDAVTVSFEYTEGRTIVGTAPIVWFEGQIEWSDSSYAPSGTGVVRVIDPDMNWNPESWDRFEINVRSDSDPVGIALAVVETSESSGIFEGEVTFTASDTSSGHRLRVAEGDRITAEYEDHTLPKPHDTSDDLELTAGSHIGALTAPLERVRVSNMMIADGIGSDLGGEVSAGQQVQVSATLANNQEVRDQPFVYIVVVSDAENGTVASLSWIVGHLRPGQQLSAATSWLAKNPGTYEVSAFVWESITKPSALAPPSSIILTVN